MILNQTYWVFTDINILGSKSQESSAQCSVGSPPYLLNLEIIGAEDDYFDSQQEQVLA